MKTMFMLAGLFVLGAAHAEVYKCIGQGEKVIYQERPCETRSAGQVTIKPFDPDKIAEAQAKLAESLKQDAEREAAAAEAAQKERELQAQEAMLSQARNRTDAINRNTQALETNNQAQPPVYYYPAPQVIMPPRNNNPPPNPRPQR